MTMLHTSIPELTLEEPDPIHDAPFTLQWFTAPYGRETLLLMGNADHEISEPSLENEQKTIQEFVDLKAEGKQLTWMLHIDNTIIGAAWIELFDNHDTKAPSVHLMIGAKEYRGKGIGQATMRRLIEYVKDTIETDTIYSRHLTSNQAVARMNHKIGFINDGDPYIDENGLEWQLIQLKVK
jgi:RimJ/RimL family protein N-acetyltransferase